MEFEREEASSCFHPGRSAQLMINGKKAGIIGQIHPQAAENFEIPTKVYMGVIDIEPLVKNSNLVVEYKPLPKYPAVTRDIAMLVKDEVPVKQIEEEISKNAGDILESLKLFDVYKGEQITEGMKSVAYSISFRSSDRTLKDEEVNNVMDNILKALKNNLGADLRG